MRPHSPRQRYTPRSLTWRTVCAASSDDAGRIQPHGHRYRLGLPIRALPDAVTKLRNEGVGERSILLASNVMIDSLEVLLPDATRSDVLDRLGLAPEPRTSCHPPPPLESRRAPVAGPSGRTQRLAARGAPRAPGRPSPYRPASAGGWAGAGARRRLDPSGQATRLHRLPAADGQHCRSAHRLLGIQEERRALRYESRAERPITVTEGTNHVVGLASRSFREWHEDDRRQDRTPPRPAL
jgi:hypothetical protein